MSILGQEQPSVAFTRPFTRPSTTPSAWLKNSRDAFGLSRVLFFPRLEKFASVLVDVSLN